jgi:two-component system response regulator HydG
MRASGVARAVSPVPLEPSAANLLIVDGNGTSREAARQLARETGFEPLLADNLERAYRLLEAQNIDFVLLNLEAAGSGGLETLHQLKVRHPEILVIVLAAHNDVRTAVQAMKIGAYEYRVQPVENEELRLLLRSASDEAKSTSEQRALRERVHPKQSLGGLVGRSPEMEKLYRIIAKAAQSTHPVLILGENGTGKELVARSIHLSGPYKDKPFIPLDCGSLLPTVIESELFGYARGAFPGALRAKDGLLAIADGGTIFLDEVGELPVDVQAKLLRVIQEHEFRPQGSMRRVPVNVRLLAATSRDLEQAVAEGRVRRDFYFRLNVLTLRIPPLRERRQDISLLAQHFLERLSRAGGMQYSLSEEALKAMLAHDWPGNVRELENCLERACTMSSGPVLRVADLPAAVRNAGLQGSRSAGPGPHILSLAELEKQAILTTIDRLNGDKLLAARLLGIGKTTLYRKLKDYASGD